MDRLPFLSRAAWDALKKEDLPLAVTKWLVFKAGRKLTDCMYELPEFKDRAGATILSWLNVDNSPTKRLLFESREHAWRYLAALPASERTYYVHIPKDAPVAFYLDIDKKYDERWEGHPRYDWEQTLDALDTFVMHTYYKLTKKIAPIWTDESSMTVFSADGPGATKFLSKHVHTTKDPANPNRFWFSRRSSLTYFLKRMQKEVAEAYWDPESKEHTAAKILAYTRYKERFHEVKVKRKDGETVEKKERALDFVFDVQGSLDQWRLPLCRKSNGVPLCCNDDRKMEAADLIGLGDPVLVFKDVKDVKDVEDVKDFVDADFEELKEEEKKKSKKHQTNRNNRELYHSFETPSVKEQLQELLQEQKAAEGTYIQRRSEFFYSLEKDAKSKMERPCLVCNRTHGSCPGWILVHKDYSCVTFACLRDRDREVEFPLPGGSKRVENEDLVRQLRINTKLFESVKEKLSWYTHDLHQKVLTQPYHSKQQCHSFDIPLPANVECPYCEKKHKKLQLEVTRICAQATIVCTRNGRKTDKRGRVEGVSSAKERFQAKRQKLMEQEKKEEKREVQLSELEKKFELHEDPDSPFIKPLIRNSFDKDDPITWLHFEHLLKSREPYTTFEDLKTYALRYINRVFARVGAKKYVYKDNLKAGLFTVTNDLSFSNMKIECEKTRIKLEDILDRLTAYLPIYTDLDFWPDPATLEPSTFNLWPGFEARLLKKPLEEFQDDPRLAELKQYYRDIHCHGDEACYRHEMRVFQLLYREPATKKEGIIFLQAGQGSGKNTGLEFQRLVLGKRLYISSQGNELLNDQYTDHLEGKLLVVADELAVTQECFRPLWERLKKFSTDGDLLVNKKYCSRYSINNFAFLFIISNHETSVRLDKDDRRYACFEVAEAKKSDWKYWKDLRARCFNQETADLFFSWLYKTHEFDDVNIRNLPQTDLRARIIENSQPVAVRYLQHLASKRSQLETAFAQLSDEKQRNLFLMRLSPKDAESLREGRWIKTTHFFRNFKDWASDQNEKIPKERTFAQQISKMIQKKKKVDGFHYDLYSF